MDINDQQSQVREALNLNHISINMLTYAFLSDGGLEAGWCRQPVSILEPGDLGLWITHHVAWQHQLVILTHIAFWWRNASCVRNLELLCVVMFTVLLFYELTKYPNWVYAIILLFLCHFRVVPLVLSYNSTHLWWLLINAALGTRTLFFHVFFK